MVLINPEIIKCQFLNKTFYVNQTNGNNPVSLEKPLSTSQRPLCIDSSNLEVNLFTFVTEKCNLSCPFCFEEKKGSHQLDISPRYTLEELVSFLHRMCIEKATIWFFGGEPLLNFSWIISCVDRLKKEKLNARIISPQILPC